MEEEKPRTYHDDLQSWLNHRLKRDAAELEEIKAVLWDEFSPDVFPKQKDLFNDRWDYERQNHIKKTNIAIKAFAKEYERLHKDDLKKKKKKIKELKWIEDIASVKRYHIGDFLDTCMEYYYIERNRKLGDPHYERINEKRCELIAFIADAKFYEFMSKALEKPLKESAVQKYLVEFKRIKAMKIIICTGKFKNQPVYSMGYFNGRRSIYYLKATLKKQLETFNPYSKEQSY